MAVGLLYQRATFGQEIDSSGSRQALYPFNDPGELPITPLRQAKGEWVRLPIALPVVPANSNRSFPLGCQPFGVGQGVDQAHARRRSPGSPRGSRSRPCDDAGR